MMKRIRICNVVRNSIWHDPRVRKQIEEYNKYGFSMFLVGEEDSRVDKNEIASLKGEVHIVKIKEKFKKRRNKLNTLIKEIYVYKSLVKRIISCKPDIIHANDLETLLPAYYAAKKIKCKIIYDSHEIFVGNSGVSENIIKRLFWNFVEHKLIKKADAVVCVSNAAADYLADKYNIKKPMVITNCCNKQVINNNTKKSEKFEILNHGKFYTGRGFELMLKSAQITDNKDIMYVLRGIGKLERMLKQYTENNNIQNVTFKSPVKSYELISYAQKSHVGLAITIPINTNYRLSVSNRIFEYTAAGLPVIMSDIPEHRYLNEKYNFGIILKENTPEALREAVLLLYENKELYDIYSKNALTMASEMNWENEFKKLIDFEINLMK